MQSEQQAYCKAEINRTQQKSHRRGKKNTVLAGRGSIGGHSTLDRQADIGQAHNGGSGLL